MVDQYVGPSEDPDRYRLVEVVGQGGEGAVWRAETASGPATTVAVKVLQPPQGIDVGSWAGAWRDRVSMLRSESQPGVVTVRESFLGPPAHPVTQADVRLRPELFVVSNWIDGSNLRTWAASRSDDELRTTGPVVLAQVAAALDSLHSGANTDGRPVAHLDLKPENVLVDRTGQAWLGDFGLARLLGGTTTPNGYTPPEVRHGGDHWPASDRYALGGLAYFLATRRDPPLDPAPGQLRSDLLASPVLAGNQDAVDQILVMLGPDPRNRPFPARPWAEGVGAALAVIPPAAAGGAWAAATLAGPAVPPPPAGDPAPPSQPPPPPAGWPAPPTAPEPGPPPTAPYGVPAAGPYAGGPPGGGGQPPAPFGAPPPPAQPKKSRTGLIAAIVVIVLVLVGAGVFLLTRDSGTSTGSGANTDTADTFDTGDTADTTDTSDTSDTIDTADTADTTPATIPPTSPPPTVPAVPAVCAKVADITAVTKEIQAASSTQNIDQIKASIAHGAQIFAELAAVAPPEIKADADFVAGSWYRYSQVVSAVTPGDAASANNLQTAVATFQAENDGPQVKNVDAYLAKNC